MKNPSNLLCMTCSAIAVVSVLIISACGGGSTGGGDGGGAGDGGTSMTCDGVCSAIIIGCKMQNTMAKCVEACLVSISDQRAYCVDLYNTMGLCFIDNKSQFACDAQGALIMPSACQPAQTAYLETCYH